MRLEFFYDIVSPYSYLAAVVLDRYRARWSLDLVLRPAFLGGVMKAVGNVPPATLPQRAPYLVRDIGRLSRMVGVEMTLPEVFPGNTLTAMRFLRALEDADRAALFPVSVALWQEHWGAGRAVDTPDVIVACAARGGLAEARARELVARAGDADVKEKLKASGDEAVARGAFGFPTMFVQKDGDDEMFFGHDRLPVLAFEMGLPWHGPRP